MMKRIIANTYAKKTSIFAAIFCLTCILMGFHLDTLQEESSLLSTTTAILKEGQAAFFRNELPRQERGETPSQARSNAQITAEYPEAATEPLPVKPLIDVTPAMPGGFVYTESIPLSYDLQLYTYQACINKQLDYELVLALMWRESRFQVDAVNMNDNGTQDSGIMQINDVNREWLLEKHGISDLMDPVQNIDAGIIMLSAFVKKYGVHDALMAYQYGEQGMQEKIGEGVVTNDLIAKLIAQRSVYKELLQSA